MLGYTGFFVPLNATLLAPPPPSFHESILTLHLWLLMGGGGHRVSRNRRGKRQAPLQHKGSAAWLSKDAISPSVGSRLGGMLLGGQQHCS